MWNEDKENTAFLFKEKLTELTAVPFSYALTN